MQLKDIQDLTCPVIIGEYRGYTNNPRTVLDDKDIKQEKGVITHFIETKSRMQITPIKEFHEIYNKDYETPFVIGKGLIFGRLRFLSPIQLKRGVRSGIIF
jgi:hypothetical protein